MQVGLNIELEGERLALLPERAVWWEGRQTLLAADLHWGKAAAFRAAAIPVPEATTGSDLERLTRAIEQTGARRLVLLGDLIHARSGRTRRMLEAVEVWREQHPGLELLLVRGNHDRSSGDPPQNWRI